MVALKSLGGQYKLERLNYFILCMTFSYFFVAGGTQVQTGRLQHTGVNLCGGRGPGYRRGRPHCLLRCTEESYSFGTANGAYWT